MILGRLYLFWLIWVIILLKFGDGFLYFFLVCFLKVVGCFEKSGIYGSSSFCKVIVYYGSGRLVVFIF